MDFIGHDYFNVGGLDDEPDKDDPFEFFGVFFVEFLTPQAKPKGPSKPLKTGIDLVDVRSGRGGKKSGRSGGITLEWWKCYLDSCASYHTFFVKEFLKNTQEGGGTMTGNCNAGTTRITKKGSYGDLQVWLNK